MTKRELIDCCLTYPSVYEDYPFDTESAVMRHSGNKKMFALVFEKDGVAYINLKCEPMRADFLRSIFQSVTPGWHIDKIHWNTVILDDDVPFAEVWRQIENSYSLIKPKIKRVAKESKPN